MTQLVVRIPEEQKRELVFEAQRQKMTVSELARGVITRYIEQKRKKTNQEELEKLLAIAAKGKHIKSPRDLSTNYKRYLYGDKRL